MRNIHWKITAIAFAFLAFAVESQAAAPSAPQGIVTANTYDGNVRQAIIDGEKPSADGTYHPGIAELPFDGYEGLGSLGIYSGDPKTPPKADVRNNYTMHLRFYFYAPKAGKLQFAIASDDPGNLLVSTDADPAKKVEVAVEPQWNPVRAFAGGDPTAPTRRTVTEDGVDPSPRPCNHSPYFTVTKGQVLYVEAVANEGGGGDNLAVAYRYSGDPEFTDGQVPITGDLTASVDRADVSKFGWLGVSGSPLGFSLAGQNGGATGTKLDKGSIKAKLDGAAVTTTIEDTSIGSKVNYAHSGIFLSGSVHKVEVTAKDTGGNQVDFSGEFTVPRFGFLSKELMTTADKSKPGFLWRVHQNNADTENSNAKSERIISGALNLPNLADASATGPAVGPGKKIGTADNALIEFEIPTVINFDQGAGNNGAFTPDEQMPGIPGVEGSTDGIVAEIITWIELPKGLITMGVNSDDGFHTSAGRVGDKLGSVFLGEFNGGRGASDTVFTFVAEEAGVYGFRTTWEEGGGGANIEWFTLDKDRKKALVNGEGGFKAYRARQGGGAEPFATEASPAPGSNGVSPDTDIRVVLADNGSAVVDQATVKVTFDGAPAKATVNKTGGNTTIVVASTGVLAPASSHSVSLSFTAGGVNYTRNWSFNVGNYTTLSTSTGTKPGSGKDAGFRIRTVQSEAGRGNSDSESEKQLLNNSNKPNLADLSLFTASGFYVESGVINYNQDAPGAVGNFNADNGNPDKPIPGIPGTTGSTDNLSQEILTYLDLPAGVIRMGVNSDDGFNVKPVTGADAKVPPLGIFNGGRGASDTIFFFVVPQAGVYPMRLIWYEGGGGANAEWFTVNKQGEKILINSTAAGAIKAYRGRDESQKLGGDIPTISVARDGANVKITFTGKLQSADAITGPWTDVAGATSPRNAPVSGGPVKFWRSRQ